LRQHIEASAALLARGDVFLNPLAGDPVFDPDVTTASLAGAVRRGEVTIGSPSGQQLQDAVAKEEIVVGVHLPPGSLLVAGGPGVSGLVNTDGCVTGHAGRSAQVVIAMRRAGSVTVSSDGAGMEGTYVEQGAGSPSPGPILRFSPPSPVTVSTSATRGDLVLGLPPGTFRICGAHL
jgi:hypothetical protein